MFYPHVIRLRGPWQFQILARFDPVAGQLAEVPTQRQTIGVTTLPANAGLLGEPPRGRIRLMRRFTRPTNLDDHERLWLVVGSAMEGDVMLNDSLLGRTAPGHATTEFDITLLVGSRNSLDLEFFCMANSPHERLLDRVQLEVRSTWQPG